MIRAILAFALLVLIPCLGISAEPEWLGYDSGAKEAAASKKPMAVFVGDWADKVLSDDTKQMLADCYVTVYVDTKTEAGKSLLRSFEIANRGLVISTAGGGHQAYSLSGTLNKKELVEVLAKHCDPDFKFEKTEVVVREGAKRVKATEFQEYRPSFGWSFGFSTGG